MIYFHVLIPNLILINIFITPLQRSSYASSGYDISHKLHPGASYSKGSCNTNERRLNYLIELACINI